MSHEFCKKSVRFAADWVKCGRLMLSEMLLRENVVSAPLDGIATMQYCE